jgi:hypothetical protein
MLQNERTNTIWRIFRLMTIKTGRATQGQGRLLPQARSKAGGSYLSIAWAVLVCFLAGVRVGGTENTVHFSAILVLPLVPAIYRLVRASASRLPLWLLRFYGFVLISIPVTILVSLTIDPARTFKFDSLIMDVVRILSLALIVGGVFWSCTKIRPEYVLLLMGIGVVVRYLLLPDVTPEEGNTLAETIWKFRIGPVVPFVVLGMLARAPIVLQMVAMAVLAAITAQSNLRSALAALALSIVVILITRGVPAMTKQRVTVRFSVKSVVAIGVAVLFAFVAIPQLALAGYFGESIQEHQAAQVGNAGVFGGRIEPGATVALFQRTPLGLGPGVWPSGQDLRSATEGLIAIGVNPSGGDFDAQYMREGIAAGRIFLHSNLGETWWYYGLPGALLVFALMFIGFRGFMFAIAKRDKYMAGLLLYATSKFLWDCVFEPVVPLATNIAVVAGVVLFLLGEKRGQDGSDLEQT